MGTGGALSPGVKVRPERDAEHSPPSTDEIVNEWELYLLSPLNLHKCVVGLIFIRKSKVFTKFERALTYRYVVY
jgi:hypothetical protein